MDLFHLIRADVPMKNSLSNCHVSWQKGLSRLFVNTFHCAPLPSYFGWETSVTPASYFIGKTNMNNIEQPSNLRNTEETANFSWLNHCWTTILGWVTGRIFPEVVPVGQLRMFPFEPHHCGHRLCCDSWRRKNGGSSIKTGDKWWFKPPEWRMVVFLTEWTQS